MSGGLLLLLAGAAVLAVGLSATLAKLVLSPVGVANTTRAADTTSSDSRLNSGARTLRTRTDGTWWFVLALGAVTIMIVGLLWPAGKRPR